jgi:hypothetical protein
MRDIRTATIYQIVNRKTRENYIGSTRNRVATRWNYHLDKLKRGIHELRQFQEAWDRSKMTDWDFRILEISVPMEDQFEKELKWQDKLHPTIGDRTYWHRTVHNDKKEKVLNLLRKGRTYRSISKEHGVSLGWITTVKHKYLFT